MNYCFAAPLVLLLLRPALSLAAAELDIETLRAWDRYIQEAKARMNSRLNAGNKFLWVDESPDRLRRVRNGEILASPMDGSGRTGVRHGLIHHWLGAAFIPNTTFEKVLATLDDYDHYKDFYAPTVIRSTLIARNDTERTFSMTLLKKVMVVTAVVEGEYKSSLFRKSEKSWYGFARSTRIQEVVNYGESTESRLPPGIGSGYLWRLYSISRFEERDRGVYIEMEEIVLSRCVPTYLEWVANPVISRMSRSALVTSLSQMRDAVRSLVAGSGTVDGGTPFRVGKKMRSDLLTTRTTGLTDRTWSNFGRRPHRCCAGGF